jgi:hypothetical protein
VPVPQGRFNVKTGEAAGAADRAYPTYQVQLEATTSRIAKG